MKPYVDAVFHLNFSELKEETFSIGLENNHQSTSDVPVTAGFVAAQFKMECSKNIDNPEELHTHDTLISHITVIKYPSTTHVTQNMAVRVALLFQ